MKQRSVFPIGLASAMLALSLTACGSTEDEGAASSSTVRFAYEGLPQSWDPSAGEESVGFLGAAYENLVKLPHDASGDVEPQLATKWTVEDKSLTFELRDGVKFHDGTDFNAEAVKFDLEHVIDSDGPWVGDLASIDSVNVVDDLTVRIDLKYADPGLLRIMGTRATYLPSPKAIEDGTIAAAPVGTSPWAYDKDESIEGGEQVFRATDDYWGGETEGRPETVRIIAIDDPEARFNALQTGDVDVADIDPSFLDQAEEGGLKTSVYEGLLAAVFLFDRGPGGSLENLDVRKAVCSAINGQDIIDALGQGNVSSARDQRYAEDSPFFVPDLPERGYDIDAAKNYLSEAGNPEVDLNMAAFIGTRPAAEVVQGSLDSIGVGLKVDQLDPSQYFTTWNSSKYSMGIGPASQVHPLQWYSSWFAADAPNNPSGWEPPELKEAADKARAAGTGPEAAALWQEVIRVVYEQSLTCADFAISQGNAFNPDKVEALAAPPLEASGIDYESVRVPS